jgi:hypothetical protein
MKTFLILLPLFCISMLLEAGDGKIAPMDAIRDKEYITIFDGSSFYTFRKDGSFDSGPCGIGGRRITGTWAPSQDRPNISFVVDGQWSWIDGLSNSEDFRRMVFDIRPGVFRKTTDEESHFLLSREIFQCYFVIDELTKKQKK